MKPLAALLLASTPALASLTDPLNPNRQKEEFPFWEQVELVKTEEGYYYSHDDVYTEILDYEESEKVTIAQNIRICIEDDCEIYFHYSSDYDGNEAMQINLAKTKKTKNGNSGINPILKAIGKGVSGGAKLKIGSLKVNADGSFELKNLEFSAGAGAGADAPIPGYEDGKQVHYK